MNKENYKICINLGLKLYKISRNGEDKFTMDNSLEHLKSRYPDSNTKEKFVFSLATDDEINNYEKNLK